MGNRHLGTMLGGGLTGTVLLSFDEYALVLDGEELRINAFPFTLLFSEAFRMQTTRTLPYRLIDDDIRVGWMETTKHLGFVSLYGFFIGACLLVTSLRAVGAWVLLAGGVALFLAFVLSYTYTQVTVKMWVPGRRVDTLRIGFPDRAKAKAFADQLAQTVRHVKSLQGGAR